MSKPRFIAGRTLDIYWGTLAVVILVMAFGWFFGFGMGWLCGAFIK